MELLSAGAAQTVTGSAHLIEARGRRILIDCGLFQGPFLEPLNREPFPFDPASVDAVLVTHAHLDHVGRLPLLVQRGYKGPIHATRATRAVAKIVLEDSGKIQQEDYDRALRRRGRGGESGGEGEDVPAPLYVPGDVDQAMARFHDVTFDAELDLGAGVVARFRPAGHILGSAFLEIRTPDGLLVASGDLGNRESAIQTDAVPPPACDAVLIETTYADRSHRSQEKTLAEFQDVLRSSGGRGGMILIPSFALERTQVVLYQLKNLMERDEIPRLPVFLDSPMAARMTRLYQECANEFEPDLRAALESDRDPFEPPTLEYAVSREESMAINRIEGGAIVIAGAGMMTGGRILHHLKRHLSRPEASVIVTGFQAEGTLGRQLVDGARSVRIHGREITVEARIATINGFSAHADQDDLLAWLAPTGSARVYMVHGEPPVMGAFAATLAAQGREAVEVERGRRYALTG